MNVAMPGEAAEASEWVLTSTSSVETQLYWRLGALHAEREVETVNHELVLYRDLDGKRGSASAQLAGDAGDGGRVRTALTAAGLALNPPYRLPQGPASYPAIPLGGDELPGRQALEAWQEEVLRQIARAGAKASHLELFAGRRETRVHASNGRSHRWQGDRLLVDLVVASGEGDASTEFRLMREARLLRELLPAAALDRSLQAVRDRVQAVLPPTGRMPVVLPASELETLLFAVNMHTNGQFLVTGMLQKKVGDALIETEGDAINIASDPLRPFGVASAPTDGSTVPARRLELLDGGVIRNMHADAQFGAYLGIEPTGPVGTLVWQSGTAPAAELLADGPVLEVVAFSALMPDPMTGSFAAEIKMGYLHRDGKRIPVAQGSVTGNVFEALARCRLSRETEEGKGYFGPAQVRFEQLQVAGE